MKEPPVMAKHVSAREARARFAELTDQVRYTGESVIVEKQGKPFVALVSLDDLATIEHLRRNERVAEFSQLSARAAKDFHGLEPTEEEIITAVRRTREVLYREHYGTG